MFYNIHVIESITLDYVCEKCENKERDHWFIPIVYWRAGH